MPQKKICLYTYNPVNNTMTRYLGMRMEHVTKNMETRNEYDEVYAVSPELNPTTYRITDKQGELFLTLKSSIFKHSTSLNNLYTLWFDAPNDAKALDMFKTAMIHVKNARIAHHKEKIEQLKEDLKFFEKTPITYGIENQIEYKTFN